MGMTTPKMPAMQNKLDIKRSRIESDSFNYSISTASISCSVDESMQSAVVLAILETFDKCIAPSLVAASESEALIRKNVLHNLIKNLVLEELHKTANVDPSLLAYSIFARLHLVVA